MRCKLWCDGGDDARIGGARWGGATMHASVERGGGGDDARIRVV